MPAWSHGRPAGFDVTVACPLTRALLAKASQGVPVNLRAAALAPHQWKLGRHVDHCRALGADVILLSPSYVLGTELFRVYEPCGVSSGDWPKGPGRTLLTSRFTSWRPSPCYLRVETLIS